MDFAYHYTEEQQRFRREVNAWLDRHVPDRVASAASQIGLVPEAWDACRGFMAQLGAKGWIAPATPVSEGGAGLTPDHELVLWEELDERGLQWLVQGAGSALRFALQQWGSERQQEEFLDALVSGRIVLWHVALERGVEPDPQGLGVQAERDGDDYILNGEQYFLGPGLWPDFLWVLARTDSEEPVDEATATFVVPPTLEGVRLQTLPRVLTTEEPRRVTFENTRVPAHYLIGNERDSWSLLQQALLTAPFTSIPTLRDQVVEDLIEYARDNGLAQDDYLQQLVVEASIHSQITRLFRTRDAWMRSTGQDVTYHEAQTARWEKRAALRLSQIIRDVLGFYALLDPDDPHAPSGGRFSLQQQKALAVQNPNGVDEAQARVIAEQLGLGKRKSPTYGQRVPGK